MSSRLLHFCLVLLVSGSGQGADNEWTRFRGPNGSGIGAISSLPAEISRADYEWINRIDGVGHSSPVLWGDQLYITVSDRKKKELRVECYQSSTGSILWTWKESQTPYGLHQHNSFASSTPTTDASGVYLSWGSGTETIVVALDHQGKPRWRQTRPAFTSDHGFGASPILVGGHLILHTDSTEQRTSQVFALDTANGEELWRLDRPTEDPEAKHRTAYSTPVSLGSGDTEQLIVLQTNDGWRGLAPATGETLWRHQGNYDARSVGSIASDGEHLFASFGSGGAGKDASLLKLSESGEPLEVKRFGIADGLGYVPTPIFHDGHLYLWADGGILTCRIAATGEEVFRERIGGNFFSSPIVADGKIYCGSRDGEFIAVSASPEFEELGRSRFESGFNATPAIANGRLFLRTDTHLISVRGGK
ncbi:MAG: PQQ-binding-like beta-propeller repeat protein [Verrucomicrobiota bacterium]